VRVAKLPPLLDRQNARLKLRVNTPKVLRTAMIPGNSSPKMEEQEG
jgi:hypothetical protein